MTRVLVVTNSYDDAHVNAVKQHVEELGGALARLDVDRMVRGDQRLVWDFENDEVLVNTDTATIHPLNFDSVWYRKPFGFGRMTGFVESVSDPVQRECVAEETRDLMESLFACLADRFWLNTPAAIARARLKAYQIHLAQQLGLPTPPTIITNDPHTARQFCSDGPTVFKPLSAQVLTYGDKTLSIETTLLTAEHMPLLDLVRSQPVMLQRHIQKRAELRVTCVGEELFVAMQLPNDPRAVREVVDWRALQAPGSSRYVKGALGAEVSAKVRRLLRRLDLGFAAMDFAVDQHGHPFFLEVNPNGQWLGYTEPIGLPAARQIAMCLVGKTKVVSSTPLEGGVMNGTSLSGDD